MRRPGLLADVPGFGTRDAPRLVARRGAQLQPSQQPRKALSEHLFAAGLLLGRTPPLVRDEHGGLWG